MPSPLLSPKQIAARLNISIRLARDLIRNGDLSALDVSRRGSRKPRYRVSEEDLAHFEANRTVRVVSTSTRGRKKKQNSTTIIKFF